MRVPKIVIAFVFKGLIERGVMRITNRLALLMKMHHILIKQIVGVRSIPLRTTDRQLFCCCHKAQNSESWREPLVRAGFWDE